MKKLMTMLAAVATAFGLYATDVNAKYEVGFEAGENQFDEGGILKIGEGTWWSCPDGSNLKEGTYAGEYYKGERNPAFAATNEKFLDVKTALTAGSGLLRSTNVTVTAGESLYFDQLVKFTATDEPMTVDEAKIAFYVQDLSESDTPVAATNLYVVAGRYVGGELTDATTYDLGAIDITEWHRLTIKAIKAYEDQCLAFQVFVDGVAKQYLNDFKAYDDTSAVSLDISSKALNFAKKLFPSMDDSAVITGVELAGQGGLDDFIATTTLPGDFADDLVVELSWDEHVATLKYTPSYGSEMTVDMTQDSVRIPWAPDMTITVNPTFISENWAFDKFEGDEETFEQDGMTLKGIADKGAKPKIVSKDTTPRVEVTIGGKMEAYPTIAKAIAAINAAKAAASIVLKEDMTLEDATDFVLTVDEAVEIDLAGKTITGVAGAGNKAVIMSKGALTIKDAIGTGAVIPAQGEANAVISGGKLTVTGGKFVGVVTPNAGSEVSGGTFKKGDEAAFPLTLKTGFTAEEKEGYWVVSEMAKATISLTYESDKVSVTGATDQQEVYVGETITIETTPATGYDNAVVTINGEKRTMYTVVDADVTSGIEISVAVTAIRFNVKFVDQDDVEFTDLATSFTVADLPFDFANTAIPDRDGYTKPTAWKDGDEKTLTPITSIDGLDTKETIEAIAYYEAATYKITYTFKDDKGGNVDDGDISENNLPEEYTFGEGAVFNVSDITTSEKYVADSATFDPTEITATDFGDKEVVVTLTLASVEPARPSDIDSGDENQKKAYDAWKAAQEAAGKTVDPTDPLTVDRSILNMPADATEAELKAELASIITTDMLNQILANGFKNVNFSALADTYPNATFEFVEAKELDSVEGVSGFYRLTAKFVPANKN